MSLETSDNLDVRISSKTLLADGVVCLELVPSLNDALPSFTAGAHIDVFLPNGLVRQYSLSNSPAETHRYVLGVRRDPSSRGGSLAVHDLLREGDSIKISSPRNKFPLISQARHSILLAGGIGITPILSMAEQLLINGESFELHYSCRTESEVAFKERLNSQDLKPNVRIHLSRSSLGSGRLDFSSVLSKPKEQTHLYICGSSAYVDSALTSARLFGWSEECLHREFFSLESKSSDESCSFRISLARSGKVVFVDAQQTALEALKLAGVDVPSSCEQGVCGTCLTTVVAGVPLHRDSYLTPQEQEKNDQFLPCCSRALCEELVLDL